MYMPQQVNGLFDFLDTASKAFTSAGSKIITGAQTFRDIKTAFRTPINVPTGTAMPPPSLTKVLETASRPLSNGAQVRELQTLLANFGFSPGKIDGIFGPLTRGALNSWQRAAGYPVTQNATTNILQALRDYRPQVATYTPPTPRLTTRPPAQAPSGFLPYTPPFSFPTQSTPTVPVARAALPSWAIPAGIGAVGLVAILAMSGRGAARRR